MIIISKGFTLIELMVILSIIAIISSIAAPSFNQQFKQYKFDQESQDVLSLFREARAQAILLKKDVKLTFTQSISDIPTASNYFWHAKNAQITTPSSVEFDMLGRMKSRPSNGCISITDKNNQDLKKAITINVLGGIEVVQENAICL